MSSSDSTPSTAPLISSKGTQTRNGQESEGNCQRMRSWKDDARHGIPQNWDEVYSLQKVLLPYIQIYARIAGKSPPNMSPWQSLAFSISTLQKTSDYYWREEDRDGDPPDLAQLIAGLENVSIEAIGNVAEKFTHPAVRSWRPAVGSLLWHEEEVRELQLKEAQTVILEGGDGEIKKSSLQTTSSGENPQYTRKPITENVQATSISKAAHDARRYMAWLSCLGYGFFSRTASPMSWETWCAWCAPTVYRIRSQPRLSGKIQTSLGSDPGHQPTAPGPTISLKWAIEGHAAWMTSCERAKIAKRKVEDLSTA